MLVTTKYTRTAYIFMKKDYLAEDASEQTFSSSIELCCIIIIGQATEQNLTSALGSRSKPFQIETPHKVL